MEVYAEMRKALGEIKKDPHNDRYRWVPYILKRLESLFGEEVLEYIIVLTGNRLNYGKW